MKVSEEGSAPLAETQVRGGAQRRPSSVTLGELRATDPAGGTLHGWAHRLVSSAVQGCPCSLGAALTGGRNGHQVPSGDMIFLGKLSCGGLADGGFCSPLIAPQRYIQGQRTGTGAWALK